MHCHSTCSDGSLPARVVAERAAAREVELFCLSDHDTCEGYDEVTAVFPDALRGVELSCTDNDRTVHLLIYQKTSSSSWHVLEESLVVQKQVRRDRVYLIAERLQELGVELDSEYILRTVPGVVGRPHIAAELVRNGTVRSKDEAFSRFLKDGGPGDVKVSRLSLAEGIELGKAAGGCMSLAHPHLYGKGAEELIRRHLEFGLSGLEVHYAKYKSARRAEFAGLAEKFDLVQTGGSDFHEDGPGKPVLGVDMSDTVAQRIFSWLERDIPKKAITT